MPQSNWLAGKIGGISVWIVPISLLASGPTFTFSDPEANYLILFKMKRLAQKSP
jgi:hypothetical protein